MTGNSNSHSSKLVYVQYQYSVDGTDLIVACFVLIHVYIIDPAREDTHVAVVLEDFATTTEETTATVAGVGVVTAPAGGAAAMVRGALSWVTCEEEQQTTIVCRQASP